MQLIQNNPLVTVLLPVYNGEDYLMECIDSILNQTFSDFQLVIVNDASTDATGDMIQSLNDKRIAYFENEKNQGLVRTLNKGLFYSKGEYIARMDADDICNPYRLEKQLNYFQATNADIIGSNAVIVGYDITTNKPATFEEIKIDLLLNCCIIHPSVMMKKSKLLEHSLYYDKTAIYAEDYKLWVDAILNNLIIENMSENLISYRMHENQTSSTKRVQQEITANLIRFSYAGAFFSDLILNQEKEYLMLLYPSDAIFEDGKDYRDNVYRLAEELMECNSINGYFKKDLFDSFLSTRVEIIEGLTR